MADLLKSVEKLGYDLLGFDNIVYLNAQQSDPEDECIWCSSCVSCQPGGKIKN